jgi:8-oxo-dGTP pyrophosphatase MutT (NUDIX family)
MRFSDIENDRAAGCLIYAREDDQWLMVRRSAYVNDPLVWCIPGGHVEPGETCLQGAIREAKEEIGYDLTDAPNGLIHASRTDWPPMVYKVIAFQVPKKFKPVINWESDDHCWCGLDDMPDPLHWGMDQLLSNDHAAERLKKWLDRTNG